MRKIRKSSAAVATVATLALALTACSSGGNEAPETEGTEAAGETELIGADQSVGAMENFAAGTAFKATEPLEFSLMYRDHPNYPVSDDWSIFANLEANQNVTFNRTDIPLSDWDNKRSLLIGAGDFPDITTVFYPGQESQFVASQALLPVSDYIDYLPNFKQKVEEWELQDELDTHRQDDGKYYILPGLRQSPDVQYSVCINDDLWSQAGITEDPATWDAFAEDLAKVKEATDVTYPFSDRWNENPAPLGALQKIMGASFDTVAGWDYSPTVFNEAAGEFELTATTDGYKEMVTYLAGLVADGLLDPEITQVDDIAIQKFLNGESAAISCNTQVVQSDLRDKAAELNTTINTHLIVLPAGPAGNVISGSRLAQGVVLNGDVAEKPYFKALLQFVDWLYFSDEGIEFAVWGAEGETFEREGDKRVLNADINGFNQNLDATKKLQADFGYFNGVFMAGTGSTDDLIQSTMTEEIAEWTSTVLANSELRPTNPASPMDEAQLEQLGLLEAQVKDAVNTATAEFITGKRSLDDWDAFVAQINQLGGEQIVQNYNEAFQKNQ
ncbi:extracellular solute-binding protein family 1 [Xylanimonas cellulosilytica DSM 15894]|uniref:Extracellular solute-binding protein family 1 n=1 Tax=Xylanimonas cellulosilytica (strain DSM 15894 / JCM 12276 / CECT 5975 / KCTC 9989 / LMG 20990 / NBRC 107835 / XIL07) TaxID=446471 RepID=D1BVD7_XYLCX|nr:extracellular solute-binding protein [Xylanimonas cellulosilytica]ACZ29408.1 extracellular solute-binding protein family 1 [Xylanimonas cellulosilytica DSM 15894]